MDGRDRRGIFETIRQRAATGGGGGSGWGAGGRREARVRDRRLTSGARCARCAARRDAGSRKRRLAGAHRGARAPDARCNSAGPPVATVRSARTIPRAIWWGRRARGATGWLFISQRRPPSSDAPGMACLAISKGRFRREGATGGDKGGRGRCAAEACANFVLFCGAVTAAPRLERDTKILEVGGDVRATFRTRATAAAAPENREKRGPGRAATRVCVVFPHCAFVANAPTEDENGRGWCWTARVLCCANGT